jgi:hypothetical protein
LAIAGDEFIALTIRERQQMASGCFRLGDMLPRNMSRMWLTCPLHRPGIADHATAPLAQIAGIDAAVLKLADGGPDALLGVGRELCDAVEDLETVW